MCLGKRNEVVDPQPCLCHGHQIFPNPISGPESDKRRHLLARTGQDFAVGILGQIIAGSTGAILFHLLRLNFPINKIGGCSQSVGCGSQEGETE